MRVIAVGDNGTKHLLDIGDCISGSRKCESRTPYDSRNSAWAYYIWRLFPLVGYTLDASWANDYVGYILDMLPQALEIGLLYEQIIALDVFLY